ncbi:uncharacterized protein C8R40DRAFT_1171572 [Lentinula edodes]|uniref:uncharacterized protein n=1 Tax=Lentinula edodes TaxID=5353 RepID=UPI001E8CF522|nr:uncharacterized protein C8R40DRAFT_1171572 [Lentinula edodes]KAH7874472.1 hypothetical protein C8R40DRAFT_1171572 [Lentinula edodes]
MPFREFARLKLVASVTSEGNTMMKFEPSPAPVVEDGFDPNVLFHFESSLCNGINTLTVYVSPVVSTSTSRNQDRTDEPLNSLPGSDFQETLGSSFSQWAGEMSNLNPLFGQLHTSPLPQGTPGPDVSLAPSPSSISHRRTNQCYIPAFPDYEDSVDAMVNNFQYWTDPFAMSFPKHRTSSTSSVSLPTTPSGTTSPASNLSEISMDDLGSISSPEAVYGCTPHHPSEAHRQAASSSSLAPRHRAHSRSRRSSSHPNHLSRRGVPTKSSFPCTFDPCPEVFSRKHDRMRHEVAQHGLKCQWVCDRCRKFFASEKTLAKHKCSVNSDIRWTTSTGQDGDSFMSI